MDLFDSNRDFLGAFLKHAEQERERKAPTFSSQRTLVFNFANRLIQNRNKKENAVQINHYDARLVEHLNKNGGWNHNSQLMWSKRGFELSPAKERIKTLQTSGFLSKNFEPTPKFNTELQFLKQKLKDRTAQRFGYFREIRKQKAQELFQKMTPTQKEFISHLGTFRQMTPAQAKFLGTSSAELKALHERGIVEVHHVLCNQRPMQLYSLTKKNGRDISGKDLARDGAGIDKPASGIQRDHSKLLHDVSVLDAVRNAKAHFAKKGYKHIASISEHQMYQTKTSSNSDTNQHYADAYLTLLSPGGDEETVAVEFGNYAPSYMKEKMQGIDADHRVIYTHDANRAEEYRNVLTDISGSPVDVFVISSPHMEVER